MLTYADVGMRRIMKSAEPYHRKLQADTWFYAKRCLLALMEHLSKNMLTLQEQNLKEIITFLSQTEIHGKGITTVIGLDPQVPAYADVC